MATTTNFGWETPDDTDLVKDGAAAMRTLGNSIDTSFVDLKGGTSGQILSKATNADMDFAWIANDQGDITGITATSPLTGGGTSGAVTVGIQASSTTQSGAVQLTDSTSSTSTTTAATPNSVKTSYDLAAAAVPKSTVTTAGDLIYGTGSSTVTRLGIGTAGQVLRVNSGATAPEWAAPAGGGKVLQVVFASTSASTNITSTSYTDTGLSATITPTSATSTILVIYHQAVDIVRDAIAAGGSLQLLRGATSIQDLGEVIGIYVDNGAKSALTGTFGATYRDSPATTSATTYKTQGKVNTAANSNTMRCQCSGNATSTMTLMEIGA
jgi:hypothetical protein